MADPSGPQRGRSSPPHQLFNAWDDVPGTIVLRHHLLSYAGLSGGGVKLHFCTKAWSDAPSRKRGHLKDLIALPFQAPQVPFRAIFVENRQYRTQPCDPKTAICSCAVPAHSSREKRKEKKNKKQTQQTKTSSDIASRGLGKRPDCTTRGAAQEAGPNTPTAPACFTLSVSRLGLLSHFTERFVGNDPVLRIRDVLCCFQLRQI